MIWRTMSALKTTCVEGGVKQNAPAMGKEGRTVAFGSRNRGERALQTSCIEPSSAQVAAMIGSRYCGNGRKEVRGGRLDIPHVGEEREKPWLSEGLPSAYRRA